MSESANGIRLRVLIADDEPLAAERLRRMLSAHPRTEIVAECGNGALAARSALELRPDVIFLDVQMPGVDGLQALARLPVHQIPAIVFATAHPEFAVDAFRFGAVDYLLKPFDRQRFDLALERATAFVEGRRGPAGEDARRTERLAFRVDGRVVVLRPDEIHWVEAADNYVILHLAGRELMIRETLKSLELQLKSGKFARVHRSAFVHVDQVAEIQPHRHGDYVVVLRDGTRIPLSRSLRGHWPRLIQGSAEPCSIGSRSLT